MRGIFRWKSTRKPKQRESTSRLQQTGTKALYSVFLFIYFFFSFKWQALCSNWYCIANSVEWRFIFSVRQVWLVLFHIPRVISIHVSIEVYTFYFYNAYLRTLEILFFFKKKLKTSKNMLAHFQLASIYAHTHIFEHWSFERLIHFILHDWLNLPMVRFEHGL